MNTKQKKNNGGSEPLRRRLPLERVETIRNEIASGRYPNTRQLAELLETGHRTIKRDLAFMRDRMKMPIEYDQAHNGFYFSKPLEPVRLTESEMFSLLVTQTVVHQFEGTAWHAPLAAALRKLTGGLDQTERVSTRTGEDIIWVRRFAPEEGNVRTMELVTSAVRHRQELRFRYRKPGQKLAEQRRLEAYQLVEFDSRWYVRGRDPERKGLRTFALCLMSAAEVTERHFVRPPNFNPNAELERSVGLMSGDKDYEVVIELDAWLTDIIRGRRLNQTQECIELPDGTSRLRVRVSCLEEITRWVLSWGEHANVIGPMELRERLARVGTELAGRYGGELRAKA